MAGTSKVVQLPLLAIACVITTALALFEPVLAAGGVALLIKALGWQHCPVLVWVITAPILYAVWLFALLSLYTLQTTLLGLVFEKPRRWDSSKDSIFSLSAITLITLYRRAYLVTSLPMILHFAQIPLYAWLIPRSYSTKLFLGQNAITLGIITDPDLAIIGADVILGHGSKLVAHSFTRSPGGTLVYQSARIELGRSVTVGGGAQIEMGVTIGEGSLIEPCSHLMPFTRIPAGEVWGGQPAVFRRKRGAVNRSASSEPVSANTEAGVEELAALIAEALSVARDQVTSTTKSADLTEWDSIGQMAIAAALHDRYGVIVPADKLFAFSSVAEIQQHLTRSNAGESVGKSKFLLPANPELFPLYDPALITTALARKAVGHPAKAEEAASRVRVVIASSFTAEPLASTLKLWSNAFGIAVEVEFYGFNQVQQALLSPESPFYQNREGLNVVLLRPEDIASAKDPQGNIAGAELLRGITLYVDSSTTPLLVSDLPTVVSIGFAGDQTDVSRLRSWWCESLERIESIEVLGFSGIIEDLGTAAARNEQLELVAGAPYSAAVYQRLGIGITRALRKHRIPPKKVLALDCDGTLWGGVVGEDGMAGIQLGESLSGKSYGNFQSQLLALKKRGVLLALVSKNAPADVWDVMDDHPAMVLRRKDVAAARINWESKSSNLRELATEMNLGLDSFGFVDDSPVERLEVETNCPEVTVIPMPTEPALFCHALSKLWLFDSPKLTREDAARNEQVQQEGERKRVQEKTGDLQTYLQSLELKVEVRQARTEDLPRVAQLTQKTNQFNLSLKRRTEPEIRELQSRASIWVISAKDQFGDYGLVGTCITTQEKEILTLDSFLLSCRALGRGIETAFLHLIVQAACSNGAVRVVASYVEGPRNQPAKSFLTNNGFAERNKGVFELEVSHIPPLPSHIQLQA
jgi:FkbH-like protein